MDTAALFDLDRDIHFDPSQDPPLDAMSRYPIRLFWRGCELTYTLQIYKAVYCGNYFYRDKTVYCRNGYQDEAEYCRNGKRHKAVMYQS